MSIHTATIYCWSKGPENKCEVRMETGQLPVIALTDREGNDLAHASFDQDSLLKLIIALARAILWWRQMAEDEEK